jgi:hypothetical protein
MNSISDLENEAPDKKPCSSGPAYSNPERLTPRNVIGSPLFKLMIRFPDVPRTARPLESSPFMKRPPISCN